MVDVSNKQNNAVIKVTVSNGNTNITATADTAQYWSKQSRLSAENSKESAQESKHYAELANSYIDGFEGVVSNNTNNIIATSNDYINQITGTANTALTDIEGARVDAVDNITTVKSESIASVEAKGNEANALVNTGIANINTAKTEAVNAVTTTKNNAVTEINKEVTDGKKELNDIIEAGGSNINDKITNCLLEVPQNIKLELNNGTLTLKAGSKVIIPNGKDSNGNNIFNEYVVPNDLNVGASSLSTAERGIALINGGIVLIHWASNKSGTSPTTQGFYYHTGENKFYRDGVAQTNFSFPIMVGNYTTQYGFNNITQVFNGMGYFGSTEWRGKDIDGLFPWGRNDDGTLNNIQKKTTNIATKTYTSNINVTNGVMVLDNNGGHAVSHLVELDYTPSEAIRTSTGQRITWVFNTKENRVYEYKTATSKYELKTAGLVKLATNVNIVNGVIQSMTPCQTFRAVDYNDFKKLHVNNPYFFGQYIWSEFAPSNLSWLKSSGQWNSGSGYQSFYDWALTNANANKAGFKLSTASYTDYDFVVNTSNKTFRLPIKVKNLPMGTTAPIVALNINSSTLVRRTGTGELQNGYQSSGGTGMNSANGGRLCIEGASDNEWHDIYLDPNGTLKADLLNATLPDLYLYFYVGETVRDEFLIDVAQIASNFADKIGRTECKAYITETYSNGTSWYRVWSDGWCEQGGGLHATADTTTGVKTITFLKPFVNANYTLTCHIGQNNSDNISYYRMPYDKTATGFTYNKLTNLVGGWYACGYIS